MVPIRYITNEGLYKIYLPLNADDWHGSSSESIWAEKLDNSLFKVKNLPYYFKELSFNDVISIAEINGDMYIKDVIERSGHSTYRIILHDSSETKKFTKYWTPLEMLGCTYENATNKLFAIDIPPNANIYEVYKLLEKGETDAIWEFEEGHCGHSLDIL